MNMNAFHIHSDVFGELVYLPMTNTIMIRVGSQHTSYTHNETFDLDDCIRGAREAFAYDNLPDLCYNTLLNYLSNEAQK